MKKVELIDVTVKAEISYDDTRTGAREHLVNRIQGEIVCNLVGSDVDLGMYSIRVLHPELKRT